MTKKSHLLIVSLFLLTGCTAIYGWNIHGPSILSVDYPSDMPVIDERVALYIPEGMKDYISTDKGRWYSDPQTYYIGESFVPMLVEAFQHSFSEFILVETTPTTEMMQHYGIPYLVVVEIKGFANRKNLEGQGLDVFSETTIFKSDLKLHARFETRGASEARGVFAKKGGPEVNLNAAIESNLRSVVEFVQGQL